MRHAIGLPNVGPYGDVSLLVDLAGLAEGSGWDGVFVWDHVLYHQAGWPVADPTVTMAAIAATTERVRLGVLMTALPRRRPWKVAKEMATLDRLSGGRLVFGAGLGSMEAEYTAFGEDPGLRTRAAKLDEALDIVSGCWSGGPVRFAGRHYRVDSSPLEPPPLQRPRLPIWIAGRWPHQAPFRRAARWDGVMPTHERYGKGETMPPAELRAITAYIDQHRSSEQPFDIVLEGATAHGSAQDRVAAYADAGVTWWVEALGWWRGDLATNRRRVAGGPPAA